VACLHLPTAAAAGLPPPLPLLRSATTLPPPRLTTAVRAQKTDSPPSDAAAPAAAPAAAGAAAVAAPPPQQLVGEDAAAFDWSKQSLKSWAVFGALLTLVMGALYAVWVRPGGGLGEDYLGAVEAVTGGGPEATVVALLAVFACAHSGLAGLRPYGESSGIVCAQMGVGWAAAGVFFALRHNQQTIKQPTTNKPKNKQTKTAEEVVGPRAYRVVFALVSLCLAVVPIVYFINHRYDGTQLWDVRGVAGVHEAVWITNFISFFFLYPSTFNILEVAAVDKPKLHLWETGIMRISRHPQMVGQGLWCAAHCLWTGSSVVLAASAALMAHHLFGCWHGDRRLRAKYGDAFEDVKARTSIMPFQAVGEGRQKLPEGYWKEFVRWPYAAVTAFTLGAYFAHPLMQQASYALKW
jgi:zeta-carotene isomerase